MRIVTAGSAEFRSIKFGEPGLLCSACFGPDVFVRESSDPPYLNPEAMLPVGVMICGPSGSLPLHVPSKALEALERGFDPRLAISEYIRVGLLQEAGRLAEARSQGKEWFLSLLKGRGRKKDFVMVFGPTASLIEGTLRAATARKTAHSLLDEMGD